MLKRQLVAYILIGFLFSGCGKSNNKNGEFIDPNHTYTKGNQIFCSVHNIPLENAQVPIVYGLLISDKRWSDEYEKFPNAHTFVPGGCVSTPDSPEFEMAMYCPKCREVESEISEKIKREDKEAFLKRTEEALQGNGDKNSLLHAAASKGYVDIVKALINNGADIRASDEQG